MTTENIESGEQKMNLQDYQGVFVLVQQVDHKITGVSYELLGKGKEPVSYTHLDVYKRQAPGRDSKPDTK